MKIRWSYFVIGFQKQTINKSDTKIIIVRYSFFRKTMSIVLLSFIVIINQHEPE
jgi:hypothetical protein